jgi:hypothetical protein
MRTLFYIFIFVSTFLNASTKDSVDYKQATIYKLTTKNKLTVYERHVSCRGIFYRKYVIQKQNDKYILQTFKRLHGRNFPLPKDSFSVDHIFTRIKFTKFKKYTLSDTNVVAFAKFEILGKRDGYKDRAAGDSWGNFFIYLDDKEVEHFTDNTSEEIDEFGEAAIPTKYWDDEE